MGDCLRHPICTLPVVHAIEELFQHPELPELFRARQFMRELHVPVRLFRSLKSTGTRNNHQQTPSHGTPIIATQPPVLPLVKYLLRHYRFDRKGLRQGLRYAVLVGNLELVSNFIGDGARVPSDDSYELEVAARRNDLDLLKVLLETGRGDPLEPPPGPPTTTMLQQSDLDLMAKWASHEMLQYLEERWNLRPSLKSILSL